MNHGVARLYEELGELAWTLDDVPRVPRPDRVLLVEPTFREVEDRFQGRTQWRALVDAYRATGMTVRVIPGVPLLPDLAVCSNLALPVPPGLLADEAGAVLSIMRTAAREAEVPHIERFLVDAGVHVERLDPWSVPSMEGTADGLWHPGRALLWAGVGRYSARHAWQRVAAWTGAPVVLLELIDERFTHLDTCLSLLDEQTAVFFPGAFTERGAQRIRSLVPRCLEVSSGDAMRFVCNGHSPDGEHFIVQAGSDDAVAAIKGLGFEVIELDAAPFGGSGSSVHSMKLAYWAADPPIVRVG